MITKTNLELSSWVRTVAQRDRFISNLEELEEKLFASGSSPTVNDVRTLAGPGLAEYLLLQIDSGVAALADREGMTVFLNKIIKELLALPIVQITLAFEPSEKQTELLAAKVKGELGQKVILELNLDERILGGAVVAFQGNYIDNSVRRLINEKFPAQKDQIVKLV